MCVESILGVVPALPKQVVGGLGTIEGDGTAGGAGVCVCNVSYCRILAPLLQRKGSHRFRLPRALTRVPRVLCVIRGLWVWCLHSLIRVVGVSGVTDRDATTGRAGTNQFYIPHLITPTLRQLQSLSTQVAV